MLKISETFMWNRTNFVFSQTGIRTNLLRKLELKRVGIRPKMRNETQGENGIVSKGIISKVFQSIKRAFDISPFPLVPAAPWGRLCSHLAKLGRTGAQEQRPSGNGDREAIVVGAGLCDGEGERAYTEFSPNLEGDSSENFVRHSRKVKFYS